MLRRRAARDALLERTRRRRPARAARRHDRAAPGPGARGAWRSRSPSWRSSARRSARAREVVLVPGNHDHALVAPWLERARRARRAAAAGPRGAPGRRAPAPRPRRSPQWLAPATLTVAYPGIWLRDDVYATHGHYLDRHTTVPTFERLGAGIMGRLVGAVPEEDARPDDYEAALAPLYAWMHAMAERSGGGKRRPAVERRAPRRGACSAATATGRCAAACSPAILPLGITGVNRLGPRAGARPTSPPRSCAAPACSRWREVVAPARHRGEPRPLRPHAPRRPVRQRRLARVDAAHGGGRADEHRLLGLRGAVPAARALEPVLARIVVELTRPPARRSSAGC